MTTQDLNRALGDIKSIRQQMARTTEFRGYGPATLVVTALFAIMAAFNDLKQLCSLTDGNLSRHLSVLEKDAMVEIVKSLDRNRPQTMCRITASGRKRYLEYLSTLEQVVRDAAKVTKEESATSLGRSLLSLRA